DWRGGEYLFFWGGDLLVIVLGARLAQIKQASPDA
ncbi:hypothetical protein PSYMO_38263, partial [Pseudomonas amygdali pv. mori str. 301020]